MTEHQIFILIGLLTASLVWGAPYYWQRWHSLSEPVRANVRLMSALIAVTFGLLALRRLPHRLQYWSQLTFLGYIALGLTVWIARDGFARSFVPPASARQVGWIRALACAALLVLALKDDVTSTLLVPAQFQNLHGPVGWLVERFPQFFELRDQAVLSALQWLTIVTLGLAMVGLGTRATIPLAGACYTLFYFTLTSYSHFFHSGLLPLQLLYLLSFLPAGHGLSIDAYLRQRAGKAPRRLAPQSYGYAVFACVALYGLVYYDCALSKLAVDPLWADAQNLKSIVLSDSSHLIDHVFGLEIAKGYVGLGLPDAFFGALGGGAVLIELSAILLLFRRRWSRVLAPAIFSLHIGIYLFQKFVFPDLLVMPLMFVSVDWLISKLGQPLRETAEPRAERRRWPYALATSLVTVVVVGSWWCRWQVFPIATYWGMYSVNMPREAVSFYRLVAEYRNGEKEIIDLTREIDFLGHARWLDIVRLPKGEKDAARIGALLESYARVHNAKRPPDQHVTHFIIESRRWHFAKKPREPDGDLSGSWEFDVPTELAQDR